MEAIERDRVTTRATTHTIHVRGIKVRTRTPRRYVAVAVRPEPIVYDDYTYVAFAHVLKRSDSYETARKEAARYGFPPGAFAVVVDLTTGEEVPE